MPPGTESIKIKIKSKLFFFFPKWSLTRINYHRQALGDSPHTVYFPRVLCQLWSPGCASRAWIWHSPRRATTHRRAHVSVIMWCHAVQCTASCDRIWYERVNVFVVALYPSDNFVPIFFFLIHKSLFIPNCCIDYIMCLYYPGEINSRITFVLWKKSKYFVPALKATAFTSCFWFFFLTSWILTEASHSMGANWEQSTLIIFKSCL